MESNQQTHVKLYGLWHRQQMMFVHVDVIVNSECVSSVWATSDKDTAIAMKYAKLVNGDCVHEYDPDELDVVELLGCCPQARD